MLATKEELLALLGNVVTNEVVARLRHLAHSPFGSGMLTTRAQFCAERADIKKNFATRQK